MYVLHKRTVFSAVLALDLRTRTAGRMARGKKILRPAAASSRPVTSILHPNLKEPGSYVGRRQVGLPGALWVGRQTATERETLFRCTIREFSFAHNFGGFVREKAWQVSDIPCVCVSPLTGIKIPGEILSSEAF